MGLLDALLGLSEKWAREDAEDKAFRDNHATDQDGWTYHVDTGKYCNHRDPA